MVGGLAKPLSGEEASRADGHVSATVARYLEAIFYMAAEGEVVRAARIAEWLGVTQATTSTTLQRIARDGLVEISPSKAVSLTQSGQERAASIVRRHRIAERWLTDYVGLDWAQADAEASRLEHALSDLVADRLFELIGRPASCPHGNPIPGVEAERPPEQPLGALPPGATSQVQRISEVAEHEAPELLRFLAQQGFHVGMPITMVAVSRAGGTVTVRGGEREVTLALEVADKVWIRA